MIKKKVNWTTETFIQKLMSLFGDDYRYDFVEYNGVRNKVLLYCPKHGLFWQRAGDLLNGHGCSKCNLPKGGKAKKKPFEQVKDEIFNKYNGKYTIPNQPYYNTKTIINVLCNEHGPFKTNINRLMSGNECPVCANIKRTIKNSDTIDTIREKMVKIYGYEKYDLSKASIEEKKKDGKITLICHKKFKNGEEHGEFRITPNNLLRLHGCPNCKQSRLEHSLTKVLLENNIGFKYQCNKNYFPWLESQTLDFYLPDYNIAIECQGGQHYMPIKQFGGKENYLKTIEYDNIKKKKCINNGVHLIYFTNIRKHVDNIETFNNETILKKINSYG